MKANSILRKLFVIGAIVDGAIAISWFLIAIGFEIPNILNGYVGTGTEYRLLMCIGAMFMMGWAVILAWGTLAPTERRELLVITSAFLLLSIIVELMLFSSLLGGMGFMFGVTKRLVLSLLFTSGYFYSLKKATD